MDKKTGLTVGGAAVILLLLGAGGLYLYGGQTPADVSPTADITATPTVTATATATPTAMPTTTSTPTTTATPTPTPIPAYNNGQGWYTVNPNPNYVAPTPVPPVKTGNITATAMLNGAPTPATPTYVVSNATDSDLGMKGLAYGSYTVTATTQRGLTMTKPVTVNAAEVSVEFVFRTQFTVSGAVTTSDGRDLHDVYDHVTAWLNPGEIQAVVNTDDGSYSFAGINNGTYKVSVLGYDAYGYVVGVTLADCPITVNGDDVVAPNLVLTYIKT